MSSLTVAPLVAPLHTVRARTVAGAVAIAAAVALPQVVHLAGGGPGLAQALLPMYLPVMVVGLLAGPQVGLAVGLLAPLASFGLTGMPALPLLPSIVVQLAVFGLVAGLVGRMRWHVGVKTLVILASGNLARLGFVLVAGLVTQAAWASSPALWWTALVVGLPGLAIQCVVVPLVAAWAAKR